MAEVKRPPAARKRVFDSVFPAAILGPPAQRYIFVAHGQPSQERHVKVLTQCSRIILGIGDEDFEFAHEDDMGDACFKPHYQSCPSMAVLSEPFGNIIEPTHVQQTRTRLLAMMCKWKKEFGGDSVRKVLAGVLDDMLSEFVKWAYAATYEEESEVLPHLKYWIENIFARYVVQVLDTLQDHGKSGHEVTSEINITDVHQWQDMAITRLGALRVHELLDIVVDWDATRSGIDDLKHYITTPATRSYLTSNFNAALSTRLLHPGASTMEILRLYISIIRAFRRLDPKGVLLDRVARMIRRYLRDREDTVKVIVAGLLSDTVDTEGKSITTDDEMLVELAQELNQRDRENSKGDEGELDWNNMDWMPDPIDAAPDYKKSKNSDVIGSLISLFETKDVFVKELQITLADRLLKNKLEFEQEISVLEHLKIRFGDSALQACEVMLRDVLDSHKVDIIVRQDQGLQNMTGQELESDQPLHAKILSRLFWPTLQDHSYKVPEEILIQQARYEKGFEALKQSRKLTWLNGLGQVEVELDLEDRVFKDEVLPWQAAVIHAFRSASNMHGCADAVSRTVTELAEELEMSPALAHSACVFWLSKRILVETAENTYTVLETLPSGDQPLTEPTFKSDVMATAESSAALAAKEAEDAARQGKMAMYNQFILSMLTNQGAMPLPRIAMMLGIVVPGGFPFSNEELKEFLSRMVRDGHLELGHGGVYKAVQ